MNKKRTARPLDRSKAQIPTIFYFHEKQQQKAEMNEQYVGTSRNETNSHTKCTGVYARMACMCVC